MATLQDESDPFPTLLRSRRKALKLSQEAAAALLDPKVSRQAWYLWESGDSAPEPERYAEIERVLEIPAGEIARLLSEPLSGGSLDYWVGRVDQIAEHLRAVLLEQERLGAAMRKAAGQGAVAARVLPPVNPDVLNTVRTKNRAGALASEARRAKADAPAPKKSAGSRG